MKVELPIREMLFRLGPNLVLVGRCVGDRTGRFRRAFEFRRDGRPIPAPCHAWVVWPPTQGTICLSFENDQRRTSAMIHLEQEHVPILNRRWRYDLQVVFDRATLWCDADIRVALHRDHCRVWHGDLEVPPANHAEWTWGEPGRRSLLVLDYPGVVPGLVIRHNLDEYGYDHNSLANWSEREFCAR